MRDPSASLSLFAIEFTLDGETFTVPPHPAVRWLDVLLANDLALIACAEPEGLIDAVGAGVVDELLVDGRVDITEFRASLCEVLTTVAGRDWWEAVGLVGAVSAEANWSRVNGTLVRAGVDVGSAPLAAWLDAVMSIVTEHMDEKQLGRFMGHLQTPPVEVGIDEDREGSNFLSMLNAE